MRLSLNITLQPSIADRVERLVSSSVGTRTTVEETVRAMLLRGLAIVGDALGPPLASIVEREGRTFSVPLDDSTFNSLSSIANWYSSTLEVYASACVAHALNALSHDTEEIEDL